MISCLIAQALPRLCGWSAASSLPCVCVVTVPSPHINAGVPSGPKRTPHATNSVQGSKAVKGARECIASVHAVRRRLVQLIRRALEKGGKQGLATRALHKRQKGRLGSSGCKRASIRQDGGLKALLELHRGSVQTEGELHRQSGIDRWQREGERRVDTHMNVGGSQRRAAASLSQPARSDTRRPACERSLRVL